MSREMLPTDKPWSIPSMQLPPTPSDLLSRNRRLIWALLWSLRALQTAKTVTERTKLGAHTPLPRTLSQIYKNKSDWGIQEKPSNTREMILKRVSRPLKEEKAVFSKNGAEWTRNTQAQWWRRAGGSSVQERAPLLTPTNPKRAWIRHLPLPPTTHQNELHMSWMPKCNWN